VKISRALIDEMVAHARDEAPNECCGAIGVSDGTATKVYRCTNEAASPLKFEMGIDLAKAIFDMEDSGAELGGIYHSHVRTAPYPSQTDQNWSEQYPGVEWVIVGLGTEEPEVRSYLVTRASVEEVALEVE
jgi:proteasome lid subunit RPN8/RPN11